MTTVTFRLSIFLEEHGDVDVDVTGYYQPDDPGNGRDDPGSPGCFEPTEYRYADPPGPADAALKEWIKNNDSELWLAAEKQAEAERTP